MPGRDKFVLPPFRQIAENRRNCTFPAPAAGTLYFSGKETTRTADELNEAEDSRYICAVAHLRSSALLIAATLLASGCSDSEVFEQKPIHCVNPFIGTGGHGHTYPGAFVPFGMVQLSPDTRLDGWDGCSGYHYTDSVIYGFSHTHLSGTGVSDYGDVLFMPGIDEPTFDSGYGGPADAGYGSPFRKSTETASPGYYAVTLEDPEFKVELSASARAGIQRYTPPPGPFHIVVDLDHRDQLIDHNLEQTGASSISGKRISKSWAERQYLFFHAEFSVPIEEIRYNSETAPTKAVLFFAPVNELIIKTGISPVSKQNAKINLDAEIPDFDFDAVHGAAREQWEEALNRIEVKGGPPGAREIFYTALYHTMAAPNLFSDVNGAYRGHDGAVHYADHDVYTVFSLWDTFRALHPLFHIIERSRSEDFLKTFLLIYEQGGRLPVWELAGNETDCMIGYHSVAVAADAYAKGIRGFDAEKMLEAAVASANEDRFGLDAYKARGYIPASEEAESVSKTLEYAYDDACIAALAGALPGNDDTRDAFAARAQNYKHLFDPETKFFRARIDGGWFSPFDPAEVNHNYTEANAWQYSVFVPHDVDGLARLHGGFDSLEQHLDRMFAAPSETTGRQQADITGLVGQYAHGNEPSHHMAYLYNYTGAPEKTAEIVGRIRDELYTTDPDGLSGNEDCGQMSAWYIFSAAGLYPVNPGSAEYALTAPLFDEVIFRLENGNTFTVKSSDNWGKRTYVKSARLNGEDMRRSFLLHEELANGGLLDFQLSDTPSKTWGKAPELRPRSGIDAPPAAAVPYFKSESPVFRDSMTAEAGSADRDAEIFIRRNGGAETPYTGPFVLRESTEITARSVWRGTESRQVTAKWEKRDDRREIRLLSTYANPYAAGGDRALIDGRRGRGSYRTGRWQGYEAQDFVAVADFGEEVSPEKAGIGFLQDEKSWIWLPAEVRFFTSDDGEFWREAGTAGHEVSRREKGTVIRDFTVDIQKPFRYLKIEAENAGPCPDWHLGSGGDSWLFADEIFID